MGRTIRPSGVGLVVGRQPSKLIYTGSNPVPRSIWLYANDEGAAGSMSALIIFLSSGLLVYWIARTLLLLYASDEAVDDALECDLWWGRRLWLGLRAAVEPPQQWIG
jgi:hypothetical protein